jgi:hypothetical protein
VDNLEKILPLLIPIIAIVMGISVAIISLVLDYRRKRSMYELVHKERLAAIDKGMEPPPFPLEFQLGKRRIRTRNEQLRSGLVLLFVGIALCVALNLTHDEDLGWAWGLLPAAIGLARLIAWKFSEEPLPGHDDQAPRDGQGGSRKD